MRGDYHGRMYEGSDDFIDPQDDPRPRARIHKMAAISGSQPHDWLEVEAGRRRQFLRESATYQEMSAKVRDRASGVARQYEWSFPDLSWVAEGVLDAVGASGLASELRSMTEGWGPDEDSGPYIQEGQQLAGGLELAEGVLLAFEILEEANWHSGSTFLWEWLLSQGGMEYNTAAKTAAYEPGKHLEGPDGREYILSTKEIMPMSESSEAQDWQITSAQDGNVLWGPGTLEEAQAFASQNQLTDLKTAPWKDRMGKLASGPLEEALYKIIQDESSLGNPVYDTTLYQASSAIRGASEQEVDQAIKYLVDEGFITTNQTGGTSARELKISAKTAGDYNVEWKQGDKVRTPSGSEGTVEEVYPEGGTMGRQPGVYVKHETGEFEMFSGQELTKIGQGPPSWPNVEGPFMEFIEGLGGKASWDEIKDWQEQNDIDWDRLKETMANMINTGRLTETGQTVTITSSRFPSTVVSLGVKTAGLWEDAWTVDHSELGKLLQTQDTDTIARIQQQFADWVRDKEGQYGDWKRAWNQFVVEELGGKADFAAKIVRTAEWIEPEIGDMVEYDSPQAGMGQGRVVDVILSPDIRMEGTTDIATYVLEDGTHLNEEDVMEVLRNKQGRHNLVSPVESAVDFALNEIRAGNSVEAAVQAAIDVYKPDPDDLTRIRQLVMERGHSARKTAGDSPPKERDDSPWGQIDSVKQLGDGIYFVGTPSHGGVWLSPERRAAVPQELKDKNFLQSEQWWEEDQDAGIILDHFGISAARKTAQEFPEYAKSTQTGQKFRLWTYDDGNVVFEYVGPGSKEDVGNWKYDADEVRRMLQSGEIVSVTGARKTSLFEGPTAIDLTNEFLDEVWDFKRPAREVLDEFARDHGLNEEQKDELKWRATRAYPNLFFAQRHAQQVGDKIIYESPNEDKPGEIVEDAGDDWVIEESWAGSRMTVPKSQVRMADRYRESRRKRADVMPDMDPNEFYAIHDAIMGTIPLPAQIDDIVSGMEAQGYTSETVIKVIDYMVEERVLERSGDVVDDTAGFSSESQVRMAADIRYRDAPLVDRGDRVRLEDGTEGTVEDIDQIRDIYVVVDDQGQSHEADFIPEVLSKSARQSKTAQDPGRQPGDEEFWAGYDAHQDVENGRRQMDTDLQGLVNNQNSDFSKGWFKAVETWEGAVYQSKQAEKFEGQSDEQTRKTWNSLGGSHSSCVEQISDVDDPEAYCAALKDRVTGTTKWRGKSESWLSIEQVAELCPGCASRMKRVGITRLRARTLAGLGKGAPVFVDPETGELSGEGAEEIEKVKEAVFENYVVDQARDMGTAAGERGDHRAPAQIPEIMELVERNPDQSTEILKAYNEGYTKANLGEFPYGIEGAKTAMLELQQFDTERFKVMENGEWLGYWIIRQNLGSGIEFDGVDDYQYYPAAENGNPLAESFDSKEEALQWMSEWIEGGGHGHPNFGTKTAQEGWGTPTEEASQAILERIHPRTGFTGDPTPVIDEVSQQYGLSEQEKQQVVQELNEYLQEFVKSYGSIHTASQDWEMAGPDFSEPEPMPAPDPVDDVGDQEMADDQLFEETPSEMAEGPPAKGEDDEMTEEAGVGGDWTEKTRLWSSHKQGQDDQWFPPESDEFMQRMQEAGPGPGDRVRLRDGTETEWSAEIHDQIEAFMPGIGPQQWFTVQGAKTAQKLDEFRAYWRQSQDFNPAKSILTAIKEYSEDNKLRNDEQEALRQAVMSSLPSFTASAAKTVVSYGDVTDVRNWMNAFKDQYPTGAHLAEAAGKEFGKEDLYEDPDSWLWRIALEITGGETESLYAAKTAQDDRYDRALQEVEQSVAGGSWPGFAISQVAQDYQIDKLQLRKMFEERNPGTQIWDPGAMGPDVDDPNHPDYERWTSMSAKTAQSDPGQAVTEWLETRGPKDMGRPLARAERVEGNTVVVSGPRTTQYGAGLAESEPMLKDYAQQQGFEVEFEYTNEAAKFGAAIVAYEFDEEKVERDEDGKFTKNDNPLPDKNSEQRDPQGQFTSNGDGDEDEWDESLYEGMGGEYEEPPEGGEPQIERAPPYEV